MVRFRFFQAVLAAVILVASQSVRAEAVLTIVGGEVSPQFPRVNNQVTASFTVQNVGDADIPGPLSLAVDIFSSNDSGMPVEGDFIHAIGWYTGNINPPLQPGDMQTISATVPVHHLGTHTARASLITEGYDSSQVTTQNNVFDVVFEASRPADLVLEGFKLNRNGNLSMSMRNDGDVIPDAYFNNAVIKVFIGSNEYTHYLRNADPQGVLKRGRLPWTHSRVRFVWPGAGPHGIELPREQRHQVTVSLDHNVNIPDRKRANNTRTMMIGGLPDLVVCYSKYKHSQAARVNRYRPVVRNLGNARSRETTLRFYIKDKGGDSLSIPSLPPGGSFNGATREVYWAVKGTHRFTLTIDSNEQIDELDDYNNIINGNICVAPWWVGSFDKCWLTTPVKCSDQPGMGDTE